MIDDSRVAQLLLIRPRGVTGGGVNSPVWETGDWRTLPELDRTLRADVCVVGLGGSGLAAVHEALDAGASVAAIDAGIVGGGAAGRNGGFLLAGSAAFHHDAVARFGRDRAAHLHRLTLSQMDQMLQETPDIVRRAGSLRIAASAREALDCDAQYAAMHADSLPVERYEGPEGKGLLFPKDAVFQPLQRCRTLANRAMERGAELFEHSGAVTISGSVVTTERGSVHCDAAIVAVDGALARVVPELAPSVRSARLQMLATAPAPEVDFPHPVYTRWGLDYWQQLPDRRVVLGGFRDVDEEREWTETGEPTPAIQGALERFLRERLGVSAPITHRWAAVVSYSASGLPILEEVRPRLWATGAYSGTGNVVGALCGRAAAQLAVRGTSKIAQALRSAKPSS